MSCKVDINGKPRKDLSVSVFSSEKINAKSIACCRIQTNQITIVDNTVKPAISFGGSIVKQVEYNLAKLISGVAFFTLSFSLSNAIPASFPPVPILLGTIDSRLLPLIPVSTFTFDASNFSVCCINISQAGDVLLTNNNGAISVPADTLINFNFNYNIAK